MSSTLYALSPGEVSRMGPLRRELMARLDAILKCLYVALILSMFLGAELLKSNWRHGRCVEALRSPGSNPAIIMGLCQ